MTVFTFHAIDLEQMFSSQADDEYFGKTLSVEIREWMLTRIGPEDTTPHLTDLLPGHWDVIHESSGTFTFRMDTDLATATEFKLRWL